MTPPILAAVMRRARKDPVGRLLARASACGVRFRVAGVTFQVAGAGALHPDDQAVLRQYIEDIRLRLEPVDSAGELLEQLGVDVELVSAHERAQEVLTGLQSEALGFDLETAPLAGNGHAQPWIKVTKDGRRAVHQPGSGDTAGLDPLRAAPRLAAIYDEAAEAVYLLDFRQLPFTVLAPLEQRPLLVHNAVFDVGMLLARGVHLRRTYDTLQLARLTYGAERGGLRLADLASEILGIALPKAQQASDWNAARLSASQLRYAALDAVVAFRVGKKLWGELDADSRRAFKLGNATVPAVAAMRLAGILFDAETHRATIARWERAYVEAHDAFVALASEEPPLHGRARSLWLEARLPEEMLAWWPRTDTGQLRVRAADIDRLAAAPEVRPLLELVTASTRLRTFGHSLLAGIGADGRLRVNLKPRAAKTGRCSCSDPNLQNLPQDVRLAVIAPPGRLFVIADFAQAELRVACALSKDEAMRAVFAAGEDMHRLNAAAFLGIAPEEVTAQQRDIAKGVASFGALYGSGAGGLVAAAWSRYRVEITEQDARHYKDRLFGRYPQLRAWQRQTADIARQTGVLRSISGRPLRAAWEPSNPLKWTLCCNYPVQSSAADLLMKAEAKVHAALEGLDAELLLQIHDELLVECAEAVAADVVYLLAQHMTAAFTELFPGEPTLNLVDISVRKCWAKPPKVKQE